MAYRVYLRTAGPRLKHLPDLIGMHMPSGVLGAPTRLASRLPPSPPPQNHTNEDIYEKAVAILETYFDVEDGEEENLAPAVAEGGECGGRGLCCCK